MCIRDRECWLQADKIEEAIKLYVENNGGIANGVASDMTESASQVPLGCICLLYTSRCV